MGAIIVAPAAGRDIESILAWTQEQFGAAARLRYEGLLIQAIVDIGTRPNREGSIERPEIAAGARTYHLFFSRGRVPAATGRERNLPEGYGPNLGEGQ
jgi:toxin ParE1/3/4